ncbi:MAG: cbb3-type cytochrome c oxidase subunit I [Candidatus Kapabacteria bacterium]|nr:cbb3-type cytochrome c oxidase subunit I [Candidatus Kapabacteria bacterium]MDW8225919.1 cbb3-type cytochrome c oxidase subunit I [Bacteroidota bacterium]
MKALDRITAAWIITVTLVFPIAILLGILMRLNQANVLELSPLTFYSFMTAHGLLMVGIWFVMSMAGVSYLLQRYVEVRVWPITFGYVLTLVGVVLLLAAIFGGGFHTGWYFLYPLPFYARTEEWATMAFLLSLGSLGVGWFVWSLGLLVAILRKYPLTRALAWHHLVGKSEPETPPFILISTTTLLGLVPAFVAAVILLGLFFMEYLGGVKQDALLMKNLTFYFGHTLVNEMLYFGIAALYELFPALAGKPPYRTKPFVALAWNLVLVVVWTAYFHHLYMDFVQPTVLQYVGQLASWIAPIPAIAVTAFSVLGTVYRSGIKWWLAPTFFFTGVMFWIIGGLGAILDAIVANNFVLHNTLWVPAHFHTYNLLGNVLFSLGFITWFVREQSGDDGSRLYRPVATLYLLGGAGFVAAFYIAGALSIMRRVDKYPELVANGGVWALVGALFAILVLVAVAIYTVHVVRRCWRVLAAA